MDRMENKGATGEQGENSKQDDARIGLTAKYKAQRASGDRYAVPQIGLVVITALMPCTPVSVSAFRAG
jgi:hypothetical protein